jgi:hypothetical protein
MLKEMMSCFSIRPTSAAVHDDDDRAVVPSMAEEGMSQLDCTANTKDKMMMMKKKKKPLKCENSMELEQTANLGARYFGVGMNPGSLL